MFINVFSRFVTVLVGLVGVVDLVKCMLFLVLI